MTSELVTRRRALTAAELPLLCDELRAVIAAGVPLPQGLREAGSFSAGAKSAAAQVVAGLESGKDLDEVLKETGPVLPPAFSGLVAIGVQTGRTEEVLAQLSHTASILHQLRTGLIRGLAYPAIVLSILFTLAIAVLPRLASSIVLVLEQAPKTPWMSRVLWLAERAQTQGQSFLIGIALAVGVLWFLLNLRRRDLTGWSRLAWLPGVGRMILDTELARAATLLQLLVRYSVPLPQALRTVADTCDHQRFRHDFLLLADQTEQGVAWDQNSIRYLPKFFAWMLRTGLQESQLNETLDEAADFYQRRAF
ncbi:MAG: type II secretion system F family protein, partial [Planctomycetaceae bacterium]|nr:type II secretion system F family protein [Planctomycetaceae bacterium]